MSRSQRPIDPSKEISRLTKRHKTLKERVADYESKLTLTTQEQMVLQKLKKEKLATKDALAKVAPPA